MAAGDIKYEYALWLLPVARAAAADISKGQLVSLSGGAPAAAGDHAPFGVAIEDIASGEDMRGKVVISGVVEVVAGGPISALSYVKAGDGGRVVDFVEGTDAESLIAGIALDSASGEGDVIRLLLR